MQPIELSWAHIKRNLSKKHAKNTTLRDVRKQLNEKFLKLETEGGKQAIHAIIAQVDQGIVKFVNELWQVEINTEQERAAL